MRILFSLGRSGGELEADSVEKLVEIISAQAYAIYPTVYTTLDGTNKVAYAVDPLRSAAGRSFWASLYGALPDLALNLPLRFVLSAGQWVVNELSSRKQMGILCVGQGSRSGDG
jgi:hypothetical protein